MFLQTKKLLLVSNNAVYYNSWNLLGNVREATFVFRKLVIVRKIHPCEWNLSLLMLIILYCYVSSNIIWNKKNEVNIQFNSIIYY
jgi:hypothetical protein